MSVEIPERTDDGLDPALARAERLVARAQGIALPLAAIGIDLPPAGTAASDGALIGAIASLYFVAELDAAGLIRAAEALAGLTAAGAGAIAAADATEAIAAFWRGRRDRPTAAERGAIYARLFGPDGAVGPAAQPGYADFDVDMVELCEALFKLDEAAQNRVWGGVAQQIRVRRAAERMADGLVSAANGVTLLLAEELVATVKAALAILRAPGLQAQLGGRGLWVAVERALRLARLPAAPARLHARRGQAGMTLLAWLAEAAPHFGDQARPLVGLDHPVIASAVDWLEASLALLEATDVRAPPRGPAAAA